MESVKNQKGLKKMLPDGTANLKAKQEDNMRVIEFETQIELVAEHHCTSVLGKKHNNKFTVHHNMQPVEESEDEANTNDAMEEEIRNKTTFCYKHLRDA